MFTSQAVADLALMLTDITTVEEADRVLKRAVRSAGLLATPTMTEDDLTRLLTALASEGGPIEQIAMHLAMHGLEGTTPADGPATR